jgi:hypothetical protein
MNIKAAIFKFSPFCVTTFESKNVLDSSYVSIKDAVWCSLADILYDELTREFIGLSFSVFLGKEIAAKELLKGADVNYFRYVSRDDATSYQKYNGSGTNDRIELFWKIPTNSCGYIYASMMMGYWFAKLSEQSDDGLNSPCGYYFFDIEGTTAEYDLKVPKVVGTL